MMNIRVNIILAILLLALPQLHASHWLNLYFGGTICISHQSNAHCVPRNSPRIALTPPIAVEGR